MKVAFRWLSLLVFAAFGTALAQGVAARDSGGVLYVSVDDLASRLGYSLSGGEGSLTLRAAAGVVVLFEDSPDILFKPKNSAEALERSDQSLAAPVFKSGAVWFAPAELLELLGFTVVDTQVTAPGGRTFALDLQVPAVTQTTQCSELVDLGNGVTGVSFYLPGDAGPETVSVLVVDLGLLGLAVPAEQRGLDAAAAKFKDAKPLYFVATALGTASWGPVFTVTQGGRSAELRAPFGVNLLAGDATTLTPDTPVSGLVLLPAWVNLRQPLSLSLAGAAATVQFRR